MAGQAPIIPDGDTIERFIARWSASGAAERANKDSFLKELCRVLGVAEPDATTGDPERDHFVFERDDLDAAVFDAYGWPHDLTDEQILERLVALNAERAAEEARGLVRWLRPDFQNPGGKRAATQVEMAGAEAATEAVAAAPAGLAWPKKLPDQIAAVRDLVARGGGAWTARHAASAFKGAKLKEVEAVLDSLAALGLVTAWEGAAGRVWRGGSGAS